MRILLTNDDGIDSRGIGALAEALSESHEVWVVAPEFEKSGGSHSVTLHDAIRVRKRGDRHYACRGTPADCVMVALLGLVPRGIDLVISGINHGHNLGTDILYSGTAAGARQGALMAVPSVALSVSARAAECDLAPAAQFAVRNLDIFRELGTDDHFLNINFPSAGNGGAETAITFPSRRIYRHELHAYPAPDGDTYCFMGSSLPDAHPEDGSDSMVLSQGRISISPIHAHPRNWASIEESYRGGAIQMNEALERAVKFYHSHRFDQALVELRELEKESGGGPEIDYYIGLALTQLGTYEDAILSLEKVVNSHFSFLHIMQARMVLGYIYSVTGRYRLAEFEFSKVNEMGLQSSQALAALGYVYYAQRKVPEGIDTLKKALEIDPRNANALNSLGFIYAEERVDVGKAVQFCRQAVDIAPRNAAYLDSLGWAYYRQGNFTEARASFRRALDLSPGNREIVAHMRLCMDALKDIKTP